MDQVTIDITETQEDVTIQVNEVLGVNGQSAYQIAVANGFSGTEAEWLDSLQGATGATGEAGATGATGPGVPVGGTAGQVLMKNSSTDYDTSWQTPVNNSLITSLIFG